MLFFLSVFIQFGEKRIRIKEKKKHRLSDGSIMRFSRCTQMFLFHFISLSPADCRFNSSTKDLSHWLRAI